MPFRLNNNKVEEFENIETITRIYDRDEVLRLLQNVEVDIQDIENWKTRRLNSLVEQQQKLNQILVLFP